MPTPSNLHPESPAGNLTAFAAFNRVASGPRAEVLARLRSMHFPQDILVRVFDDATGSRLDLDLRPDASDQASDETGTPATAEETAPAARAVGRPKLGVVAREVTLLPRHWDWLNRQPGGASVALRKLVEEARRANEGKDTVRASREAAYRFMTEIAGDLAGFEEATRALFAGDRERFESLVAPWPDDVHEYLAGLAAASWGQA
ncbi:MULTISPECIES: DUF2239 family protein [Polaromonas]|uniref:DUF2239 family protein n=1 Tax=Polaromonas aquatica TaxID=332657 RepID=A0ABW1TSX8_9BURK